MNISEKIDAIIAELALLLIQNKSTLVVAESCTGGLLSKYCTDIAGSSAWFDGGVIVYSNTMKQKILNVSEHTLKDFGAVSEQAATEMATAVCQFAQVERICYGISTTGIAGPGGGTAAKPVGTVCFAWAEALNNSSAKLLASQTMFFKGNRAEIREQSVLFAVEELVLILKQETSQ